MNVLLLREKIKLPSVLEQITADQLLTYLGECIMDCMPAEIRNDENAILNLEQNIHDAIEILPKLNTGLDVNIRFTGITDFEYTPECIVFDLLRIPLYHGWLSDPGLNELRNAIGSQSYNQLVDNIITNKTSTDPEMMAKVLIAEEFLERTASQLTEHGLNELKCQIKDNEIGILFRNNHFLTLFKREGEIYTLVTDHGYLTEDNIIWEILDSIEGAGRFFDSNFQLSEVTNKQVSEFKAIDQRQQQLENDFLMALSLREEEKLNAPREETELLGETSSALKPDDDFELAKRLQEEENRIYEEMTRESQTNTERQLVPVVDAPTEFSEPQTQETAISSHHRPPPTDVDRRWSQVVADGGQPKTTTHETQRSVVTERLNVDQTADEINQTPTATQTAISNWDPEPNIPEHQDQQPFDSNQAPSSSQMSHRDTRPAQVSARPDQPQSHQPQYRPSSGTNRRSKNERNSKDVNCVIN